MAKVTGPLFSIEARGKIADAMVHFPWKGRCVVREWKKPSNPQTGKQGDARQILGGLGRACSPVVTTSQYAEFARAVVDTGQTWVSHLVRYCRDNWMPTAAAFEAIRDEMVASNIAGKCTSEGGILGLSELAIAYRSTKSGFSQGLYLYMLGKYGCAQHVADDTKFNLAPFTVAFGDWVDAQVTALVALLPSL